MKQVILLFPNTISMAEFILAHKIAGAITNSVDKSLTGKLDDKQIVIAEIQYGAYLQKVK